MEQGEFKSLIRKELESRSFEPISTTEFARYLSDSIVVTLHIRLEVRKEISFIASPAFRVYYTGSEFPLSRWNAPFGANQRFPLLISAALPGAAYLLTRKWKAFAPFSPLDSEPQEWIKQCGSLAQAAAEKCEGYTLGELFEVLDQAGFKPQHHERLRSIIEGSRSLS